MPGQGIPELAPDAAWRSHAQHHLEEAIDVLEIRHVPPQHGRAALALTALLALPVATAAAEPTAKVRVLHGVGDAPAVDVYAGKARIVRGSRVPHADGLPDSARR